MTCMEKSKSVPAFSSGMQLNTDKTTEKTKNKVV